jgi:hypothetical protein
LFIEVDLWPAYPIQQLWWTVIRYMKWNIQHLLLLLQQ